MKLHPSRRRALRRTFPVLAGFRSCPALALLVAIGLLLGSSAPAAFVTLQVSNANDSGPGSLRQAILDANADAANDHVIQFTLPANTVIVPASSLPQLNRGGIFEALNPPVVVDGTALGAGSTCLYVDTTSNGSKGVTFTGMTFQRFGTGIDAYSPITVGNCSFLDCGYGIQLQSHNGSQIGTPVCTVAEGSTPPPPPLFGTGGNNFQRCSTAAIVTSSGGGHCFQGNLIGTTADGTASAGAPQGIGIQLNFTDRCLIGGDLEGAGNLIAGLTGTPIDFELGSANTGTVVRGNYFGTNRLGNLFITNGVLGLYVNNSPGIRIENNVINGSNLGINVTGSNASGAVILNNRIGTTPDGQSALGSLATCISVAGGASNVTIGLPLFGNFLGKASNRQLSLSGGTNQVIQGNTIGTNQAGGTLGTASNAISVSGTTNSVLGGLNFGAGNTVLGVNGVAINLTGNSTSGFSLLGNSILQSAGNLGIDLGPTSGVTPNDTGDGDTGPNGLQNFPVITSATYVNGVLSVSGTLNSRSNASFTIQAFSSSTGGTNNRQAHQFIAGSQVSTDANGNGSFSITSPVELTTDAVGNSYVTLTATDAQGNTSEFCLPVMVVTTGPSATDYYISTFEQGPLKAFTPGESFPFHARAGIRSSGVPPAGSTLTITLPPGIVYFHAASLDPGTTVMASGNTVTLTNASGAPGAQLTLGVDKNATTGPLTINASLSTTSPDAKPADNQDAAVIQVVVPTQGIPQIVAAGTSFSFPTTAGRRYRIEASTDLVNWVTVLDGLEGTGMPVSVATIAGAKVKTFYRTRESLN